MTCKLNATDSGYYPACYLLDISSKDMLQAFDQAKQWLLEIEPSYIIINRITVIKYRNYNERLQRINNPTN